MSKKGNGLSHSFLLNPVLAFAAIAWIVIALAMCAYLLTLADICNAPVFYTRFLLVLGGGIIASSFLCAPTWFACLRLTENGIALCRPFHRRSIRAYKEYPYVYKAWYQHRGLLPFPRYRADFTVLSSVRMKPEVIHQVNTLGISEKTIKIRYNLRVYEQLIGMLPEKQARELQREFSKKT